MLRFGFCTYFLYRLSQDELNNILFPLGALQKEEVREYALKNNIPLIRIPYWERDNITLDIIMEDKYRVVE